MTTIDYFAFQKKVADEVAEANRRVREITARHNKKTGRRFKRKAGRCVQCGGPADETTKGCNTCGARHFMRNLDREPVEA